MADIDWLLDRVAESPDGPQVGAFFDFDGTLIDGYSTAAFFKQRLKHGDIGLRELLRSVNEAVNVEKRGHSIDELVRMGIRPKLGSRCKMSTSGLVRCSPSESPGCCSRRRGI